MPTIRNKYEKMKPNEVCPCEDNTALDNPVKYKKCCMKKVHAQEQQAITLRNGMKRVADAKAKVAEAIQHDIDHPLILPDSCNKNGPEIIIP